MWPKGLSCALEDWVEREDLRLPGPAHHTLPEKKQGLQPEGWVLLCWLEFLPCPLRTVFGVSRELLLLCDFDLCSTPSFPFCTWAQNKNPFSGSTSTLNQSLDLNSEQLALLCIISFNLMEIVAILFRTLSLKTSGKMRLPSSSFLKPAS